VQKQAAEATRDIPEAVDEHHASLVVSTSCRTCRPVSSRKRVFEREKTSVAHFDLCGSMALVVWTLDLRLEIAG